MAREVFEEVTPVFGIFGIARFAVDKLDAIGGLVEIIERQSPWDHRVATDRTVNAHIIQHEIDPFVEDRVVIDPAAIQFLHAEHHAVEMVLRLSGPGFMHDAGGNGLLSRFGQHLHDGTHGIEVSLTPERHLIVAGHRIRVLPQIQVERPLLGSCQGTVDHFQFDLKAHRLEILATDGQCPLVFTGLGICRNTYLQPNRLGRAGLYIPQLDNVQHIGYDGGVPFRLVFPDTTTPFAVFVQLVGHHITDKVRRNGFARNDGTSTLQIRDSQGRILQSCLAPKESLGIHPFASPCLSLPA